jgi:endonuclease I/chitodextrinase
MKKTYTLFLLILSSIAFAQIPTGYYDTATATGYTLKTQLKTIIAVDNIVSGSTGYANLYTTYQTSDIDTFYENDGTILDMYSEKPSGTDPYNFSKTATQRCGNYTAEGDCYNREHIIPQSFFNQLSPMRNDAHFITPTDGKVNGYRSNYPHGMVGTLDVPPSGITNPTANGSKLGNGSNSGYAAGYSGTVFEPIDEFKGDIARMYFYFATKYQDQLTTWGNTYPMFDGSNNKVFTTTFLNILLAWNALDPVSNREIIRNNAIYNNQGNRNPYIDHPEYVNRVWSTVAPDTQNPTAPTNLGITATTSSTIALSWTAATDNVGIAGYDVYMNNTLKTSVSGLSTTITGLSASTSYTFYVIAKDAAANLSPASNTATGSTAVFVPDTQNPTAPTNLTATGITSTTMALSWTAATDNVGIASYDIYVNNVLKDNTSGLTKTITGLSASTTYSIYVIAKDLAGNASPASTNINPTTTALVVVGTSNELFFSEYVEGSGLNKALEIVNLTGAPIDLSVYSLKKQVNGAGAWQTANPLSGTLANGAVFVAVDNGIVTTCYDLASANASYSGSMVSSPTSFNGNDAVGLFKNDVLIDIIGTFNGGNTDFAANQTLRRKATIKNPNTTFDKIGEWDVLAVNTCDNIGIYNNTNLSNIDFISNDFNIFPNPSNGSFTVNFSGLNDFYSIEIFSITGQKVFEKEKNNVPSTTINLNKEGIYFVKVNQDSKSYIKKLLIKKL